MAVIDRQGSGTGILMAVAATEIITKAKEKYGRRNEVLAFLTVLQGMKRN